MADDWKVYTRDRRAIRQDTEIAGPTTMAHLRRNGPRRRPQNKEECRAQRRQVQGASRRDRGDQRRVATSPTVDVTGRPGSGKSMLIESVANELSLGRVRALACHVIQHP